MGPDFFFHIDHGLIHIISVRYDQRSEFLILPDYPGRTIHQFLFAFSRSCNGGYHRDTQECRKFFNINLDTSFFGNIHHVQRNAYWNTQFKELDG